MPSKILTEKATMYLSEDSLSHIDMLEPLRRGTANIIYAENNGVIIYERNSQACMISMQDLEKCKSVINLEQYRLFDVHQTNIAGWVQQKCKLSHRFKIRQAVYTRKKMIVNKFDTIKSLSYDYIDQICR